jgi:hypothetical protein
VLWHGTGRGSNVSTVYRDGYVLDHTGSERGKHMLAAVGGVGIVGIVVIVLVVLAVLYFVRRA